MVYVLGVLNYLRHRLWHARLGLLSLLLGIIAMSLTEVRDLFLEPDSMLGPAALGGFLLVFWAIPVHRATRRAVTELPLEPQAASPEVLEAVRQAAAVIDTWLPRVLGIAPFVIVAFGLLGVRSELAGLEPLPEYETSSKQLVDTALFMLVSAFGYAFYLFARFRLRKRHQDDGSFWWSAIAAAHTVVTLGVLALALVLPFDFVTFLGRASMLPVLLGGLLPILTPVANASIRRRAPLLLVVLGAMLAVSSITDSFHHLRTYHGPYWHAASDGSGTAPARLTNIDSAIDTWMAANGCAGRPEECPDVILVAATGGGSRSAFLTATVLGSLLDITRTGHAIYDDFGKTLFAISGISGGAIGGTIARAALADAGSNSQPPCTRRSKLWFGAAFRDVTVSWRACLQNLAAGDFLSAPIAGFAFRDFSLLPTRPDSPKPYDDRNVLIEQAIERHYNAMVFGAEDSCGGADDMRGLCRPLGYRDATTTPSWLPLLILTGTSVDTGTPVIASDLNTAYRFGLDQNEQDFYPFANGVFEFLGARDAIAHTGDRPPVIPGIEQAPDLRLSTAAVLSARFPFVLTGATLPNVDGTRVAARVVDGGYFDDSGLTLLRPLVPVLVERRLRPTILVISNAPVDEIVTDGADVTYADRYSRLAGRIFNGQSDESKHVRATAFTRSVATLDEPFTSIMTVRGARARETEENMREFFANAAPHGSFFKLSLRRAPSFPLRGRVGIWCVDLPANPTLKGNIVMSWWLSQIVQRFVDAQICAEHNVAQINALLNVLAKQEVFDRLGAQVKGGGTAYEVRR